MKGKEQKQLWLKYVTIFDGSDSKESACNAGDLGVLPGSRGCPGEGNGYPLQYSGLDKSMDRGYNPWGHRIEHS